MSPFTRFSQSMVIGVSLVCALFLFIPKSSGQSSVVRVSLEGDPAPVVLLLNHSLSDWKKVYGGDYKTAEGNAHQKNWNLGRLELMVVFSGRTPISTRIEITGLSLDEQAKIINSLGLRQPEFNPDNRSPYLVGNISWGKDGDPISGTFYVDMGMLEIRTRQDPPEE
jgi:hypothetical protein